MFYHAKELQFNARVSRPDPKFAALLLEQFGGANGELKAAMQYFVQAFGAKHLHPDKYDMLMDIATEEFSHLEIVGATIQMLLKGVKGQTKEKADGEEINMLLDGDEKRESYIHEAMTNPHFFIRSGGSPDLTDSQGIPWSGAYVNSSGDLTVDFRSDMAAESRAKMVYENLLQYTDDPAVKETLRFLMAREIAHFQMFEAALDTIQPNFPQGILQGDPKYTNTYFDMSQGEKATGPWNDGESSRLGETWQRISDPLQHVRETNGLINREITGSPRTDEDVQKKNKELSKMKSEQAEIALNLNSPETQWSKYDGQPKEV